MNWKKQNFSHSEQGKERHWQSQSKSDHMNNTFVEGFISSPVRFSYHCQGLLSPLYKQGNHLKHQTKIREMFMVGQWLRHVSSKS